VKPKRSGWSSWQCFLRYDMKKHTPGRLTDTQTSWNKLLRHHWMEL